MRAKEDAIGGNLSEKVCDAADNFDGGNVEEDLACPGEFGQELVVNCARPIQQEEAQIGARGQQGEQRRGIDMRHANERVLSTLVLHAESQLQHQAVSLGEVEELCESRVVQGIAVVVRVETQARHVELLVAAAHILFPLRKLQVDRAER